MKIEIEMDMTVDKNMTMNEYLISRKKVLYRLVALSNL
jgi:hypothetical protein